MLALITDFIVAAALGDNLAALVKSIIGPIFLLAVGIVSITFLVKRQMVQFGVFLLIAVVVAALIYAPGFVQNIGTGLGGEVKW